MGRILDQIAGSRFNYLAGTAGTATVTAGWNVTGITCISSGGGTLVITPGGANQQASALPSITIPATTEWFNPPANVFLGQLGGGTTFTFTGTDSYVVWLEKNVSGA